MKVVIINNSPDPIYPVLSSGVALPLGGGGLVTGAEDAWLEACFGTTKAQIAAGQTYARGSIARFYINPTTGIPAADTNNGCSGLQASCTVTITLPLYSVLSTSATPPDPTKTGQFLDWWQGGRVEIFTNPTYLNMALQDTWSCGGMVVPDKCPDPKAIHQTPITLQTGQVYTVAPSCTPNCTLSLFSATASIPTALPSQLTEYTFGAEFPCQAGYPCNPAALEFDKADVDFDVSYVDATFLPAVMEPFANPGNQTGWVGIGTSFATFTTGFINWRTDMVLLFGGTPPNPPIPGDPNVAWPQQGLCVTSLMQDCTAVPTINTKVPKFPSAIHIMGFNTVTTPLPTFPNDMFPPQKAPLAGNVQNAPAPWPAIAPAPLNGLIAKYMTCVGTPTTGANYCGWLAGNPNMTTMMGSPPFPIITTGNVKALFVANRTNYINTYGSEGSGCIGTRPDVSGEYSLIKHIYAWTPFNEQCGAAFNPLYWTPGYCFDPTKPSTPNCTSTGAIAKFNQTGYQNIKQVYDMLQYNGTPFQDNIPLVATMFDHYVALIHGSQYLNSLNAYSYSVDDDVGNFQGTGTGAYIAVGGTQNLPNPNNAAFPVHVNVGALTNGLFFTSYSIRPGSPPQFCSGGNSTTIANNSFVLGAYMNYMPAAARFFLSITRPLNIRSRSKDRLTDLQLGGRIARMIHEIA